MRTDTDVIVVGKGLIGSAAAKYLRRSGARVVLVGPDEPTDADRAILFASHYDSGRVQRRVGRNDTMTKLNLLSVAQYEDLQEESGITFHGGTGCLYVCPTGENDYLANAPARASRHGIDVQTFDSAEALLEPFPEFRFPEGSRGLFEPAPSGYINPRALIAAQLRVLSRNGGSILKEHVTRVTSGRDDVVVETGEGSTLRGDSVLLATGAFTNAMKLSPVKPELVIKSETVILAEVSSDEATRLDGLPSLLYDIDVPELEGIYATPPIRYPDGRHYLKMGCNLPEDIYFPHELDDIQRWFRSGDSDAHIGKMREALERILPTLAIENCFSKRCILTRTAEHGNPYVGPMGERIHVAIGNGWSAMCSDGIGQLAAHWMAQGEPLEGLEARDLLPVVSRG